MNFDHFRKLADDREEGAAARLLRRELCRELMALMTCSPRKIDANRRNAARSTGPKSARGKIHARFNALKHALFAAEMLLPGEDVIAHKGMADRLNAELQPKSEIEKMLVDQILGNMWRLRRVDQAERIFFDDVKEAIYTRLPSTLDSDEIPHFHNKARKDLLQSGIFDEHLEQVGANASAIPRPESREQEIATVRDEYSAHAKMNRALDHRRTLLESFVPSNSSAPYATLGQMRRSLIRDVLKMYESLAKIQGKDLAMLPAQE